MTDDELQAIEARATSSTPDLQYGTVTDDDSLQKEDVIFTFAQGRVATLHHNPSISTLQMCDNGGFFTTARPDILALVAEVRRLRTLVAETAPAMESLIIAVENEWGPQPKDDALLHKLKLETGQTNG
jgi:hypothetical protein